MANQNSARSESQSTVYQSQPNHSLMIPAATTERDIPAPVVTNLSEEQETVITAATDTMTDRGGGVVLAASHTVQIDESASLVMQPPVAPTHVNRLIEEDKERSSNEEDSEQPAEVTDASVPEDNLIFSKASDGDTINLHLDDADVRKALELLSREGPYNILVSQEVKGNITANLDGLTFNRTLDAILKLANLVAQREHDLIYVYSADEYKRMKEMDQQVITRVYRLRYMRGADFQEICTPFLSPTLGKISITPASGIGIESNTASVGGDSMSGGDAVIVQDYESILKTIDGIVAELDVQPTQVLIEAVIIEVTLDDSEEHGVNFAVLGSGDRALAVVGSALAVNAAGGFDPVQLLTATGQINGNANGFLHDTHGIKFGFIDHDVTGFIRALNSCGRTNVLASPRILVLNKQRAELIIGEKIGYKTLAITETSSVERVEFLNVGTQLRLRPFIVENGLIRLEVHPERSSGVIKDGVPQTSTSEVTTNVMVPNGSTIVIGGLMEDKEEVRRSGVPVLMDAPFVGALFRRQTKAMSKKELIVLLTPRTWTPTPPNDIENSPEEVHPRRRDISPRPSLPPAVGNIRG
jgi:type IV pilus secretin PilQ/predicted competence protein